MTIMVLVWLMPTLLAIAVLLFATIKQSFVSARRTAELAAGLLIAGFPFIFVSSAQLALMVYITLVQLSALLLAARLVFGRLEPAFVFPSTQRNCLIVVVLLVIGMIGWAFDTYKGISVDITWVGVATIAAVALVHMSFFLQLLWAKRHFSLHLNDSRRPLKDLPTVSVCVPARNEDHALTDCLASVLASDYPKLEVLVLDDCSQDKTSQIIRSFAHDGVRFIQGELPADGWLGKNQARQTLAEHASGDFLLFLDVDTRVSPDSISQLIDFTLDSNIRMVSVLPQNRLGFRPGAVFDTLRFYWQQVLPVTPRRVTVASQLWVINATAFKALGGFKSVAHKITPEASFARRLGNSNAYRFITSQTALGVTTAKHWPSELASAIRHLYPTYKRQPLFALGAAAGTLLLFVAPPIISISSIITGQYGVLFVASSTAWIVATVTYGLVRRQSHPHVWLMMILLLPFTALQEAMLTFASLLQYEFGEVNWKGRNICYPVIRLVQNPSDPAALQARR
ncbi:MAG TPA: glycosyltransferase [Magnetospirillaceae bacterium]|nr:glycosyltransferase [Magnetospirillaceae bacterium]